jgi:transcriptional regulator of acetoin/glycerol metabolism
MAELGRMSFITAFLKAICRPLEGILPLNEVKRRAIVDALDKCSGNYCLAARSLGYWKTTLYRMAKRYNYQQPQAQEQQSV